DLGVSTGNLTRKLALRHQARPDVQFIGIDVEENMIKEAQDTTKGLSSISLSVDNIATFDYQKSDFIVSYYTMQFVPPHIRQDVFNRIYQSLNWGGAFLLFEKVRACDARFQDMMQTLYVDFKLDQGYSSDEIVSKTKSLKGVLEPFSTQGNMDLLKRAGFVDIMTVFKYICFEGFLAIK
ncbi:MAG: methyltransferase domain-containing protein, partial [Candidatus Omnitrophica bacterium]|nr:methyltransferase domain-containing protein [Candidatus Omnitrophota bacterium]